MESLQLNLAFKSVTFGHRTHILTIKETSRRPGKFFDPHSNLGKKQRHLKINLYRPATPSDLPRLFIQMLITFILSIDFGTDQLFDFDEHLRLVWSKGITLIIVH